MTPKRISQAIFFDEVDFSADDRCQFVRHANRRHFRFLAARLPANSRVYDIVAWLGAANLWPRVLDQKLSGPDATPRAAFAPFLVSLETENADQDGGRHKLLIALA